MSEPLERAWVLYVRDMLRFAENVLTYSAGLDQAGFVAARVVYDACLRNLELIGEAATHVPDSVRASSPSIPWRLIIALRNRLIHGYLGIDDDTIWGIVQKEVPALVVDLRAMLAAQSEQR